MSEPNLHVLELLEPLRSSCDTVQLHLLDAIESYLSAGWAGEFPSDVQKARMCCEDMIAACEGALRLLGREGEGG